MKKTPDTFALNVNFNGNKKLVNNDKVVFAIWNLLSIVTCPFATELCKKSCYARKSERIYPGVIKSRTKNFDDSKKADFVARMIYTIKKQLNKKSMNGKKLVFRIHESGDFYNKEYVNKWLNVARAFMDNDQVIFIAYTKSINYFIGVDVPQNLIIRASIWDDTREDLAKLSVDNFPIYTAKPQVELDQMRANNVAFYQCRCKDCATCGQCWNVNNKSIICAIH